MTHLVMTALAERGFRTTGYLVFLQDHPRAIFASNGDRIDDLYGFLRENGIRTVINQIGFSKWLLEEFLACGGQRWRNEGGQVVTCLHFGPRMFHETVWVLTRGWRDKTLRQKVRRLGRIALLPISRHKITNIRKRAYAYLIEESDVFVVLSETHRPELEAMSHTRYPERVRVIPNPNTFASTLSPFRLSEKTRTVLVVSRLEEAQKRVSLALRAWEHVMRTGQLDNWTLKVVGEGPHERFYRELVARRRIVNVEFVGRTDPEPFYESASIYLHTAAHEGWGLTITEAMQKGAVPIVMNSSSVFAELIENRHTGILSEYGNVRAFAAHIIELMLNQSLREGMALEAIEATRQRNLNRIAEKWSEVLREPPASAVQTYSPTSR